MPPYYQKSFLIPTFATDRFNRLKCSYLLGLAQEVAGDHSALLKADFDHTQLYWVITRQKVQISRLPAAGETITLETWPMPTTRVAYPRSTIAYDAQGKELFRSISLWVLMDPKSRAMVLPGKSGVTVEGLLRGSELAVPGSLVPGQQKNITTRTVCYTELDGNGHMNNARYLDWLDDLLSASFHSNHTPREFTVCYLSEAREGETVELHWDLSQDGVLRLDAFRPGEDSYGHQRVFSAQTLFDVGVL